MDEKTLLERLRRQDLEALDESIQRYGRYVSAVVSNIIGASMTLQDVEEVVSDVFFDLWRQSEQVRPGHLKGFLSHVARNKAINKLRQQKRELSLEEDEFSLPQPGQEPLEETMSRQESAQAVRRALDQMETLDREIFLRHYYYCQTVWAVALELGLNPSTVKSRLARGRNKLRAFLLERGYCHEDQ